MAAGTCEEEGCSRAATWRAEWTRYTGDRSSVLLDVRACNKHLGTQLDALAPKDSAGAFITLERIEVPVVDQLGRLA